MSNNLGSIYATTVNGTKRIIIDSDSVDVSGNFFINGTNSRMPAEFENSIRDYLPLTYGTTSSNTNTLFDMINEVSNNLLTSNNDASFGNVDIGGNLEVQGDVSFNSNVDISGDLTLKGSLGVLDSSTNDISYGNVGSVLTSNGFGNSLSWKEPVYYSAHLANDITYTATIYGQPRNVTGLSLDTISHPNSFDTNSGIFTAPRDGIYYVDYGVLACDNAEPKGMYVLVSRIDFRTNDSGNFTQHTGNLVLGGNLTSVQSNVSSILQLNKGNQIRCVFQMTYDSSGNLVHGTKLLANYIHSSESDRNSLRATRQSVFAIF